MKNTPQAPRLFVGGILFCLLLVGFKGSAQQEEPKLLVGLSGGYQRQDFRWSIAGNSAGQNPNIYSELKWRGVNGPTGAIDLHWKAWKRWRVYAKGSRVFTRSGTMSDTDYGLDNRNDILYHESFAAVAGYDEAVAAGIGYCICCSGPFKLTAYIGYSIDAQYFPVTDPGGLYSELNSSYSAKWLGPLVRGEGSLTLGRRWQVVADAAYHQAVYHGWADWNLIPTFAQPVSFRHRADGYGVEADAGLRYFACKRISVEIGGGYFDWQTGTGIDQLYLSAGGSDQTQLNGVVREGWKCKLGVEIGIY
jgi:Protochlamydia outer membrane protein